MVLLKSAGRKDLRAETCSLACSRAAKVAGQASEVSGAKVKAAATQTRPLWPPRSPRSPQSPSPLDSLTRHCGDWQQMGRDFSRCLCASASARATGREWAACAHYAAVAAAASPKLARFIRFGRPLNGVAARIDQTEAIELEKLLKRNGALASLGRRSSVASQPARPLARSRLAWKQCSPVGRQP